MLFWGCRVCSHRVKLVLALGRRPLFLLCRLPHRQIECPHNVAASSPQSERSKKEQDRIHNVYDLTLEVNIHFHNILWLHRAGLL